MAVASFLVKSEIVRATEVKTKAKTKAKAKAKAKAEAVKMERE